MSDISVKINALEDKKMRLKRLSSDLDRIANSLGTVRNSLDSDIRNSNGIDARLRELCTQLSQEEDMIHKTSRFFEDAIRSYGDSEKVIEKNLQEIGSSALTKKGLDLFSYEEPTCQVYDNKCPNNDNNGNDTQGTIDEGGMVNDALKFLPGGEKPTPEELAQIDAIMRKYEQILIEKYDGDVSDTDIKEILDNMGKELAPIFNKHRYDFTWWYEAVKPGGPLDVKNSRVVNINVNGECKEVNIWNQPWSYNGKKYAGDFSGNYLYGYLGAEVFGTGELGQAVLKGGGGFAQYLSDKNNPNIEAPLKKYLESLAEGGWGDNEGDSDQVQLGIDSYRSSHGHWVKVPDAGKILNPFNKPIIYLPPFIVPDEDDFTRNVFIEDEPGILRDAQLISKLGGKWIDMVDFPSIPVLVEEVSKGINNLIEDAGNAINNGLDRAGEAISNGFDRAGDAIDNGLDRAGEAINNGLDRAGDTVKNAGNAIHNFLFD